MSNSSIRESRLKSNGENIVEEDIEIRAPMEGEPAFRWDEVIGKKLNRKVDELTPIKFSDFSS
jgi:sialic acid synthase SpsE